MNKKIVLLLFLAGVVFWSYGQENRITPLSLEEWDEQLSAQSDQYSMNWISISPSLSYLREFTPSSYQLMEIDLTKDLRRQAFQDKTPLLVIPKNKFVVSRYSIALPSNPRPSVTISGRGRYSSSVNNGGLKNTVYKDASEYSGFFCPATGDRLFW